MKGIYKIKNIVNDKFYLGSSKDIEVRFEQHIIKLRKGNHVNIILQRAWDKYGESNFIFDVELLVPSETSTNKLLEIEQSYLQSLKPAYNIGQAAAGGDNLTNHPRRSEIIEKIKVSTHKRLSELPANYWDEVSKKNTGEGNPNFGKRWNVEQRRRASAYHKTLIGELNPFWGKKHTEETKKKISEAAKNRVGELNPFWGKKHTEETKQKIRKKRTVPSSKRRPVSINDVRYTGISEASELLKLPAPTIHFRINSKNPKFDSYKYL